MSTIISINNINNPGDQKQQKHSNNEQSDNSDAKSISEPPAYSENYNNNETTSVNISLPSTAHLSPNSSRLSKLSTNPSSESLPTYDNVNIDMPPSYPIDTTTLKLDSFDAPYDLVPIEPQKHWPITKKLYIFGYLIWPLWYIGAPFVLFAKDQETKRWGQRCIFNAILISIVFGCLIVVYKRSIVS